MGQHSFAPALALNITDVEKFEVGKKLTGWGRNWLVIFFLPGKKLTSQFLPRGRNGPAWSFPGERLAGGKNWPLHRPTIFQSCRDGAIASWVINQYFRGVKCLAQGHNTAAVGLEPWTSLSGVRHSTTEPPRSPWSVYGWGKRSKHVCQSLTLNF